jgi:hypothetical protein
VDKPRWLQNYIVKIPMHLDNYPLHAGECNLDGWMEQIRSLLKSSAQLSVIGTHDCYAHYWLQCYPQLLRECLVKRPMRNCDEIADTVYHNAFE